MITAVWIWFATSTQAMAWFNHHQPATCIACPDETSSIAGDGRNGWACSSGDTKGDHFADVCPRGDLRS